LKISACGSGQQVSTSLSLVLSSRDSIIKKVPNYFLKNTSMTIKKFDFQGESLSTKYIETVQVIEGIECDVYEFISDSTKDLGIVRVKA
jgi:hypothetical protein